jgi:hypothetical protein
MLFIQISKQNLPVQLQQCQCFVLFAFKGPRRWRCLPDRDHKRRQEFDLQSFTRLRPLLSQGRRQGGKGTHLAGTRNNAEPPQVPYYETRCVKEILFIFI